VFHSMVHAIPNTNDIAIANGQKHAGRSTSISIVRTAPNKVLFPRSEVVLFSGVEGA
jgi:hypothetical protein